MGHCWDMLCYVTLELLGASCSSIRARRETNDIDDVIEISEYVCKRSTRRLELGPTHDRVGEAVGRRSRLMWKQCVDGPAALHRREFHWFSSVACTVHPSRFIGMRRTHHFLLRPLNRLVVSFRVAIFIAEIETRYVLFLFARLCWFQFLVRRGYRTVGA